MNNASAVPRQPKMVNTLHMYIRTYKLNCMSALSRTERRKQYIYPKKESLNDYAAAADAMMMVIMMNEYLNLHIVDVTII